jgi:hypothetical protein
MVIGALGLVGAVAGFAWLTRRVVRRWSGRDPGELDRDPGPDFELLDAGPDGMYVRRSGDLMPRERGR